jgi:spore germination protein YaaH
MSGHRDHTGPPNSLTRSLSGPGLAILLMLLGFALPGYALRGDAREWVGPHQTELERHRDHPVLAELIGTGVRPTVPLQPRAKPLALTHAVFGYLPYWIDSQYYAQLDYGLLTHISAFSMEVNADGSLGNEHGWPWTALIDSAHAHGVKVILTATLFGNEDVLALLEDEASRQTFSVGIRDRLIRGNADGVNIDFEGGGSNGWPGLLNDFMAELTAYLHGEIPGCEVSFAGPAVDWGRRFDFPGLAASCDYIFIMGYAFSGSWSAYTGPNAPLVGGSRNITTTVTGDYGQVAQNSPEKLILGVPYYGCEWQTVGPEPYAEVVDFGRYLQISATLRDAVVYGEEWDRASQTPWYAYTENGNWHQVWHDDAVSLGLKYDLALEHGYRGVGMWALGYEGDRVEPWALLEEKLGRRQSSNTAITSDPVPTGLELGQNYPNPFNPRTHIAYSVPGPGLSQMALYDVLGRLIRQQTRWHQGAGAFAWQWDGTDEQGQAAGSGLYVYQMRFTRSDGQVEVRTRRMVLAR